VPDEGVPAETALLVEMDVNAGQPDASYLGLVGVVDADQRDVSQYGVVEFGRGRQDAEPSGRLRRRMPWPARQWVDRGDGVQPVAAFFAGIAQLDVCFQRLAVGSTPEAKRRRRAADVGYPTLTARFSTRPIAR
jgi:hypothetical protein